MKLEDLAKERWTTSDVSYYTHGTNDANRPIVAAAAPEMLALLLRYQSMNIAYDRWVDLDNDVSALISRLRAEIEA